MESYSNQDNVPQGHSPVKSDDLYPEPQWRDLWAAILYYVHFAVFLAIAGWALWTGGHHLNFFQHLFRGDGVSIYTFLAVQLLSILVVSILMTAMSIMLLERQPEAMIRTSLFFVPGWLVLAGILAIFTLEHPAGLIIGCVQLILALLVGLLYFFWKKYIPLTVMIMRMVISCMHEYPSLYTATFLSVAVGMAFSVFYFCVAVALVGLLESPKYKSICAFFIFYSSLSMLWTTGVISNVLQTTIAGVFATHYFNPTSEKVKRATSESFKRAATFSFGSICIGSLVVAFIQIIRALLRSVQDKGSVSGLIVDLILGWVEELVRYFNSYAYTMIAVYGTPYVEAAKATFDLIKKNGVNGVVNDSLTDGVLGMTAFAIGLFSMLASFIITKFIYGANIEMIIVVMLFALILGIMIPMMTFQIISAGTTTMFVCMATDPLTLQRIQPEVYGYLVQKYPSFGNPA